MRSEGTGPLPATSPARWFATPATADTPFGRRLLRDLADADPVGLDRVRTGGASGVLPVD